VFVSTVKVFVCITDPPSFSVSFSIRIPMSPVLLMVTVFSEILTVFVCVVVVPLDSALDPTSMATLSFPVAVRMLL